MSDGSLVRLSATVDGDIDAVVRALTRYRLVDLVLEEPDLEESVLSLYGQSSSEVRKEVPSA